MQKPGFTLTEVIIGSALLLLIFVGVFSAYSLGLKTLANLRAKATALSIANQKLEQVRNLAYLDIGTVGGIPAGQLAQSTQTTANNVTFTVRTTVVYIDDPLDELIPADLLPTDYKRAKVEVSWTAITGGKVTLVTDITPKGVESSAGGGTLSLSIFDASGLGVGQAQLHIVNNQVNPVIDAIYFSDDQGKFVLPGAPASIEGYQIEATKIGYSSERSYGSDEIASPAKPNVTVLEGQLSQASLSIDKVASMIIETRSQQGGLPVANVPFTLTGAKSVGDNAQGQAVPKYSVAQSSDDDASLTLSNMEWDSYSFAVDSQVTGLNLAELQPTDPVELLPDSVQHITLLLAADNSLLVTVTDQASAQPVFGAAVELSNASIEYDQVRPTDAQGHALFIPLQAANYTLQVSRENYQTLNGNVGVAGNDEYAAALQQQ